MIRTIVRILLAAVAFAYVLPLIHGIAFHGSFLNATMLAIAFGVLFWIVDIIAIAVSAMMTISTFGLALLVLIPIWLVGFWLVPAFVLKLVSDMWPHYLTVVGWGAAFMGGLVMLGLSVITSDKVWKSRHSIA